MIAGDHWPLGHVRAVESGAGSVRRSGGPQAWPVGWLPSLAGRCARLH